MSIQTAGPGDMTLVRRGRLEGYAIAALALSLVSFINLLGAEKALLAIVLAVAAVRGAPTGAARQRGLLALAIAGVYVATIIVVLVVLRDKVGNLIDLLNQLG